MHKDVFPKIQVYEPGKNNKFVKSTSDHPHLDEIGPAVNLFEANGVVQNDSAQTAFLRGNPFLYNSKTSPYQAFSIEDYLIKIKKEEIAFGDVVRNPRFSTYKRRRIVKRAFKTWNNDYLFKKKTTFKENEKVVEIIGEINYLKFPTKLKIILYCMFALLLFLVGTKSFLWGKMIHGNFGYHVNSTLIKMWSSKYYMVIVANISIYLTLLLIFFSTIYTFIIKDFRRNYHLAQNFLENSEVTISRDYQKKYRRARLYYLKNINKKKRPYFPPLDISEVEEGEVNIQIFNDICQATINRAYFVKKSKPYLIAVKNILVYLSMGGSIFVIVMTLYYLVISFF
mgnify:CR=1 FL=1